MIHWDLWLVILFLRNIWEECLASPLLILLNIMFHALMGRFHLELFYLFFHRRPTHKLCFLSCRPFVIIATFSTGLVVYSVSSLSWSVHVPFAKWFAVKCQFEESFSSHPIELFNFENCSFVIIKVYCFHSLNLDIVHYFYVFRIPYVAILFTIKLFDVHNTARRVSFILIGFVFYLYCKLYS